MIETSKRLLTLWVCLFHCKNTYVILIPTKYISTLLAPRIFDKSPIRKFVIIIWCCKVFPECLADVHTPYMVEDCHGLILKLYITKLNCSFSGHREARKPLQSPQGSSYSWIIDGKALKARREFEFAKG